MRKRWGLALVLALVCVVLLGVGVSAETVAEGVCGDDLTWVLDDAGVLTIRGSGEMEDYASKAPWYPYCESISSIIFEEGVTSIGNRAFSKNANKYCNIDELILPSSMTSIGRYAFYGCEYLQTITLNSNISAGESSFNNTNVFVIYISNDVTEVPYGIYSIPTLETFVVNDTDGIGLVSINGVLYSYDDYLESYTLIRYPAKKLGSTYTIEDKTEIIAENAFYNCLRLEGINIADTVQSIGYRAFANCDNLSIIQWGSGVTTVYRDAYTGSPITKVIMPEKAVSIPILSTVIDYEVFMDTGIGYRDIDGVLFYYDGEQLTLSKYPDGRTDTEYVIPDVTDQIGDSAFYYNNAYPYENTHLTSIVFPDSVKTINENAFSRCAGLTKIILNEGLTYIGHDAFAYCTGLKEIQFPSTLTTIEYSAFQGCTYLKEVSFPESVQRILRRAFYNCTALRRAYFYGANPSIYINGGTHISSDAFSNTHSTFTIYYIEGKSGWTSPTWNGYNTATFVPEDQFAAGVTAPATATAKDTMYVTITTQNAHEGVVIEMSVNGLEYDFGRSETDGAVVSADGNTLTLQDAPRDGNMSYTLAFTVPQAGTATVQLTSATFTDANGNAGSGILSPVKATITVAELYHTVVLSAIFSGETTVLDGTNYTFTTDDAYNYTDMIVTMDGIPVDITDNGDGSYTVSNVIGDVVVTGSRTPKECTITFTYPDTTGDSVVTVPYGRDSYVYVQWNVFCTVASALYTDGTIASITTYPTLYYNDVLDKPYTYVVIPGPITQNITITFAQAEQKTAVALSNMSTQHFTNYTGYTEPGMDYTLTLADTVTGSYKVTAEMNDVLVPVVQNGRSYTIAGSDIVKGLLIVRFTEQSTQVPAGNPTLTLLPFSPYRITGGTLSNVPAATTVSALVAQFDTDHAITVSTPTGAALSDTAFVGTGCVVSLTVDGAVVDTLTIVVTGDLSGDGLSDRMDLALLQQYYSGYHVTIDFPAAADLNGDGNMTRADAMVLARWLAGWTDAMTPPSGDVVIIG